MLPTWNRRHPQTDHFLMPTCPACHADLTASSALEAAAECPFCGAAVELSTDTVIGSATDEQHAVDGRDSAARHRRTGPPIDGQIEVVEQSPDRLVLHIPPGGKSTTGLGCFALFWNGFMCLFTPPWFFALGQNQGPPLYIIVPFLLVFWSIGLGMLYAWLRMKHTRTFLLLEPERMAIKSKFLRRETLEEATLTSDSRAMLVESYQMNNVPVHRVQVNAESHTFKFATHLSEPEKEWLASTINSFLRVPETEVPATLPNFCSSCGGSLLDVPTEETEDLGEPPRCPHCGAEQAPLQLSRSSARSGRGIEAPLVTNRFRHMPVAPLRPSRLSPETLVRLETDSVEQLSFSLPLLPAGKIRRGLSIGMTLFGLLWLSLSGYELWRTLQRPRQQAFDWIPVAFGVIPLIPGLIVLWVGYSLARARIAVTVDRDWFRVRYGVGWLGKSKRIATSGIDAVGLRRSDELDGSRSSPRRPSQVDHEPFVVATVHSGGNFVPLTTLHARVDAEAAAGLVKQRLLELGFSLEH